MAFGIPCNVVSGCTASQMVLMSSRSFDKEPRREFASGAQTLGHVARLVVLYKLSADHAAARVAPHDDLKQAHDGQ